MTDKRKPAKPKVNVSYAHCKVFCTSLMRCPLCGVEIPPSTLHTCRKEQK